jgi:hypothetical protein
VTRTSVLLLIGLAALAVVVWGVLLSSLLAERDATPSNGIAAVASASARASTPATPSPSTRPASTIVASPAPASSAASPASVPTVDPRDPTAYLEFVDRLRAAAGDAERLSAVIRDAAQDGSKPAIAAAARDIQDWAASHRRWLRDHPPAACYAAAHAAAADLVEAYDAVADATLTWVDARGLAALEALAGIGQALDTATPTGPALRTALEASTGCLS